MSDHPQENASHAAEDETIGALMRTAYLKLDRFLALTGLRGKGLLLVAILFAFVWVIGGVYNVQPDEQGVVAHR